MASQSDLDQGGTQRAWIRKWMGPSVGYIQVPQDGVFAVTAAGTYNIDLSTSLVSVDVAGSVTLNLPQATNPSYPGAPTTQPGKFADNTITVVDIGGHSAAFPITINAAAGENIMGGPSITIAINYASYIFVPGSPEHEWNAIPTSPTGGGTVVGPGSTIVNDLVLWGNTVGTLIKDGAGLTIGSNYNFSGLINFTNTTASTTPSTGGVVMGGGLGVAGAVNATSFVAISGSDSVAGPPYALDLELPNSTLFNPFVLNPLLARFMSGDFGSSHPVTAQNPTVLISRTESLTGMNDSGGQNAALFVASQGANASTSSVNNTSVNGITSYAYQQAAGTGDAQAIVGVANQLGGGISGIYGFAAFGGFFNAIATNATSSAIAIETATMNNTGVDATWATYTTQPHGAGTPNHLALDLDGGGGGNQNTAAVAIRGRWDVGIGFAYGSAFTANIGTYYIVANNFNIDVNGQSTFTASKNSPPQFIAAATYTVTVTDYSLIANFGGTLTLTLPSASTYVGRKLIVKTLNNQAVVSASSNVNPLTGAAGTAILAATAGKWAILQSDGSLWNVMAGN